MGTFRYQIALGNPTGTEFEVLNALVDTGATYTFVPSSLLNRLEVEPMETVEFTLANGSKIKRDIGQTHIRAAGKQAITFVVFAEEGDAALLGSYALEGLRLAVDPYNSRLIPNELLLV
ncbi:MAG: retroviral-like aspartic protease family protein [Chloroflexi bacterium]|nr:retroviral-like aspartic protease family protein [Chloroflexota bacterium]